MEFYRVRTIIPYLNYGDLVKRKIIPGEKLFTKKTVESIGGKIFFYPKIEKIKI